MVKQEQMRWLVSYMEEKALHDDDDCVFCEIVNYYSDTISPRGEMKDLYTWLNTLSTDYVKKKFGIVYTI